MTANKYDCARATRARELLLAICEANGNTSNVLTDADMDAYQEMKRDAAR